MAWKPCTHPKPGDTLMWNEPLWAPPNKKRGKPDQIGQQMLVAEVVEAGDPVVLRVVEVEILDIDEGAEQPEGVKAGDTIKRKLSSLERGDCQKFH
jgi:hypothetical protein